MKEFIENTLHQSIKIKEYTDKNKIPLILQGNYNLYILEVNGQCCILAEPLENIRLTQLRKQHKRLEQLTAQYCVLYFKELNEYPREKMLKEGISFIWKDHQIYMPFLGIWLKQNEARKLKTYVQVSFLTQKLLLTALYETWHDITVTVAADILNVSKMSITRSFDEIESLEIPILYKNGRKRFICSCRDKKEMWEIIKPYMRNPLIKEYYLEMDLSQKILKSGISALCEYSMLADNEYNTYAIVKSQLAEFDIKNKKQISKEETPGCIVQELGYVINYNNSQLIDPLTVLMLMEKEREDPRVGLSLDEMLEEYVW